MWPVVAREKYENVYGETKDVDMNMFFHIHNPVQILKTAGMWRCTYPDDVVYKKQQANVSGDTYHLISIHTKIEAVCIKDGELDLKSDAAAKNWTSFCTLLYRVSCDNIPLPPTVQITDNTAHMINLNKKGGFDADIRHHIVYHTLMEGAISIRRAFASFFLRPNIPIGRCSKFTLHSPYFKKQEAPYTVMMRSYNILRLGSCDLVFD